MSLFGSILEKLGLKKPETETTTATPVAATPKPIPLAHRDSRPVPSVKPAATAQTVSAAKPVATVKPVETEKVYRDSRPVPSSISTAKPVTPAVPAAAPMEMVDVMSKLDKLGKDAGGNLDWKASIVDLLKLLHIDSSLEARKELAVELGCPPEKMKESQNMNIWLHKTVLQKIAENGGNIPKELLD